MSSSCISIRISFLYLLLVLIFMPGAFSQNGYIVSHQGDTIYGEVKLADDFRNQKSITFIDKLGVEVLYHADRIAAYGAFDSVHYVSRPTPYLYAGLFAESHVFLKLQEAGPASLYRYYSQRSVLTLKRGPAYFELLEKPDGSWHEISLVFGWKNVAEVFEEYPQLAKKIRYKEYRPEQLNEIVQAYNAWYLKSKRSF